MAFESEDFWVENMGFGFGSHALWSSQDFFMASVLGIEDDGFDMPPFADTCHLAPSSASSLACFGSEQSLSSELENHRVEMDLFLQLESQRLRKLILEEQRRQQASLESRIRSAILQKDHELSEAKNRAGELQARLCSAKIEAAAWEKKATEKAAAATDLRNRLNRIKNHDATSFCDSSSSSSSSVRRGCRLCRGRSSCVVFFPCRHLCCCRTCEPLLGRCPVCQTVKEASVEVYLG